MFNFFLYRNVLFMNSNMMHMLPRQRLASQMEGYYGRIIKGAVLLRHDNGLWSWRKIKK